MLLLSATAAAEPDLQVYACAQEARA